MIMMYSSEWDLIFTSNLHRKRLESIGEVLCNDIIVVKDCNKVGALIQILRIYNYAVKRLELHFAL